MQEKYMLLAMEEAKKALNIDEVPIGAVIVKNDKVIAKAHNLKEYYQCAIKHAEIIAIESASKKFNNWRLEDCELYVTVEPCPMCASAIKQARITKVYAGTRSNDVNNDKVIRSIFNSNYNNSQVDYYCGYLEQENKKILQSFFSKKRM